MAERFVRAQGVVLKCGEIGLVRVKCWLSLAYPGLALHWSTLDGRPCMEWGWTISHVPSGVATVKMLPTLSEALQALAEIGPLCDWTLSAEEIDRLPIRNALASAFNRILDRVDAGYRLRVGPVSDVARSPVPSAQTEETNG